MTCEFKPGDPVVCVDDVWPAGSFYGVEKLPMKDNVYTVREIFVPSYPFRDRIAVRLIEIQNPVLDYVQGITEAAFDASRFRPLVTRKTDITIFKAMLHPSKVEELA